MQSNLKSSIVLKSVILSIQLFANDMKAINALIHLLLVILHRDEDF